MIAEPNFFPAVMGPGEAIKDPVVAWVADETVQLEKSPLAEHCHPWGLAAVLKRKTNDPTVSMIPATGAPAMQEKAPVEEACTVSVPLTAIDTLLCWANRHLAVAPTALSLIH